MVRVYFINLHTPFTLSQTLMHAMCSKHCRYALTHSIVVASLLKKLNALNSASMARVGVLAGLLQVIADRDGTGMLMADCRQGTSVSSAISMS